MTMSTKKKKKPQNLFFFFPKPEFNPKIAVIYNVYILYRVHFCLILMRTRDLIN